MLAEYHDVLLNVILVEENVRPACLIQICNFKESKYTDPIISTLLHEIKMEFPTLIHSYDIQGVIISKSFRGSQISTIPTMLSSYEIGKILGYPCYDYEGYDDDMDDYTIDITAQLEDTKWVNIFANRAYNIEKIKEYEKIASNANEVLKKENKWGIKINNVNVYVNKNPSISSIIKKLQSSDKLNEDENHKIQNIFYNMFSCVDEIIFDESNMTHRGIVIGILLTAKHNPVSAFYPLDKFPKQLPEVDKISDELKMELQYVLSLVT